MASLELYLLTFNCARTLIEPATFAPHFFDALASHARLPDVIAISLQEIAPIAYAFLGNPYVEPYLKRFEGLVQVACKHRGVPHDAYRHVATQTVGMTAIMTFAQPDSADRVVSSQTAKAGLGLWDMGNKGAVGVRLHFKCPESEDALPITFIAAHLAPHENQVARRNHDWENIVRNLVFTNDKQQTSSANGQWAAVGQSESDEAEPLLSASDADSSDVQIQRLYGPSGIIFFAGDLNYRARDQPPAKDEYQRYPQPSDVNDSPNHFNHLFEGEQLSRELKAKRTLHGFAEAPVSFPPTYKYSHKQSAGSYGSESEQSWPWSSHRWPSWCDRILFFPSSKSNGIACHQYVSLPLQPTSDHKPVALSISVPLKSTTSGEDARAFYQKPPFPLNTHWQEREVSRQRKELVVGIGAYLTLTWEGNAIMVGIVAGVVGFSFILSALA